MASEKFAKKRMKYIDRKIKYYEKLLEGTPKHERDTTYAEIRYLNKIDYYEELKQRFSK